MTPDPIVEEVHRAREAIARKFGNDIGAICQDARRREADSGLTVVSLPPRRAEPSASRAKKVG